MKLRICIVGTAYPYKGGIAMFNERLAEELQVMGHEVEIITFTLQYPKFFFPGQSQYSDDPAPKQLKISRKVNSVNPITWLSTANAIKKGKFDLVIAKYWIPAMGPALGSIMRLVRSSGIKTISIIDNIIPHEKRPGDNALSRYFVNSVDGFITMSHKVNDQMQDFVKGQPVVYNPHPIYDTYGLPVERTKACQHLGISDKHDYVLFFGYIRDYKGLDILLDAISIARKSNDNIKLIVAGEYYSDREKYLAQIKSLELEDHVVLRTDFISNEEVKYYFSAADIVAQSYKSATQSGISQMAIAFAKPIISTNVGGLPETVRDGKTGYLVNVDPNEVAAGILKYFNDADREDFKKNVEELKLEYSWSSFGDRLINLYQAISKT